MNAFPLTGDALAVLRRLGISGAAGAHERAAHPDTIDTRTARGLVRTERGRLLLTAAGRAEYGRIMTGGRGPTIVGRASGCSITT